MTIIQDIVFTHLACVVPKKARTARPQIVEKTVTVEVPVARATDVEGVARYETEGFHCELPVLGGRCHISLSREEKGFTIPSVPATVAFFRAFGGDHLQTDAIGTIVDEYDLEERREEALRSASRLVHLDGRLLTSEYFPTQRIVVDPVSGDFQVVGSALARIDEGVLRSQFLHQNLRTPALFLTPVEVDRLREAHPGLLKYTTGRWTLPDRVEMPSSVAANVASAMETFARNFLVWSTRSSSQPFYGARFVDERAAMVSMTELSLGRIEDGTEAVARLRAFIVVARRLLERGFWSGHGMDTWIGTLETQADILGKVARLERRAVPSEDMDALAPAPR